MVAVALSAPSLAPAAGYSLRTGDGLLLHFADDAAITSAAVDGHRLVSAANGGFSVRSYTSPTKPGDELLQEPSLSGVHLPQVWAPFGTGYATPGDGIVIHNRINNVTAGAVQRVVLPPSIAAAAAKIPLSLRLSGWASTEGLASNGTCADEGSCRLNDNFGLTCRVEYSDVTSLGPLALAPAAFQVRRPRHAVQLHLDRDVLRDQLRGGGI